VTAWRALSGVARVLAILVGVAAPGLSAAHPHAWIDLRSTVVLDSEGRAIGVRQEWLFDPLYSAIVAEDLGNSTQALEAHGRDVLDRLKAYDYYTQVRVDGEIQAPGIVSDFTTGLQSKQYWIRFLVPLSTPVDPSVYALSYSVFDPTYYIEMLHLKDRPVDFIGVGRGRCVAQVEPPKPAADAIMRARSLAVDARPDNSLGALFAERVVVGCK